MKLNRYLLLAASVLSIALTSCKEESPFDSQSANDYPLILYPYSESGKDSYKKELANPDTPMHDSVIVTPSSYTTVQWLLDDRVVMTGLHINMCFPAGEYKLKIVATTTGGKSSYRTGMVKVAPYDGDPYSAKKDNERIVAPGTSAVLYGQNLTAVKSIVLLEDYPWGEQISHVAARVASASVSSYEITDFSATDDQINYTVPANVPVGTYFVAFYDAEGKLHGANLLTVTGTPLAIRGFVDAAEGGKIELNGLLLNNVQSLHLQGETSVDITDIVATETMLSAALPKEAKAGKYILSGTAKDGTALLFSTSAGFVTEVKFTIVASSAETKICDGPADMINWGTVFLDIDLTTLAGLVGQQMNVYYEIVADAPDGYHQMKFASAPTWAYGGEDKPSMPDAPFLDHFEEDEGVVSFTVTEDMYNACAEDGGGLKITGYGYKVIKVTSGSLVQETKICDGPADMINWGTVFLDIDLTTLVDLVGRQLSVYYEIVADAPDGYHQMKFASAPTWAYGGEDKPSMPDAPFLDHIEEDEGVVSFTVTEDMYNACASDGGGLKITGYGYKVIKVTTYK